MYLYLGGSQPGSRVLYLVAAEQHRVLAFRQSETNPAQAVVEFLPQAEVNLHNVIRLTTRVVKGCLGLISIERGVCCTNPVAARVVHRKRCRFVPRCGNECNRGREYET